MGHQTKIKKKLIQLSHILSPRCYIVPGLSSYNKEKLLLLMALLLFHLCFLSFSGIKNGIDERTWDERELRKTAHGGTAK